MCEYYTYTLMYVCMYMLKEGYTYTLGFVYTISF